MTAAARLRARADSYAQDAGRFADMPPADLAAHGLDHATWATMYRVIADELRKCAEEIA